MKYLNCLAIIFLFACEQKQELNNSEIYRASLEINSIGYYDYFEEFDPPLKLDAASQPVELNVQSKLPLAVKYFATELTVDYHDGNPPKKEMAGNLIFLEKIDGEWKSMAGGEHQLDSIRVNKWINQELYVNHCNSGDEYFKADYSYMVAKN